MTLSNPPNHLLEVGKQTHEFYNFQVAGNRKMFTLKSMEQYAAQHRTNEAPSKQYFKQTRLKDIIMEYPFTKKNAKQSDIDKGKRLVIPGQRVRMLTIITEMAQRTSFVDFVEGLLNLDPIRRWSPQQAAKHPFITGEKFTTPFQVRLVSFPSAPCLTCAAFGTTGETYYLPSTCSCTCSRIANSRHEQEVWWCGAESLCCATRTACAFGRSGIQSTDGTSIRLRGA